jgi:tetratricopeptide (TPR) repeat protein
MWILPAHQLGLHVELTQGPHLLPWHYVEEEIDRLAWLLRLALKGIQAELRLDDATLRVLSDRKVTAPTSLVIARVRETSPGLDEITERVHALNARCALLQFPEPQEMGYGWLEREVKAPLYRMISVWTKRPDHPLATFNVQALPVIEAASLTTDPVDLIEILEQALSHRLRHAEIGLESADYARSLCLSAGKRLAERIERVRGEALEAALEVIVHKGRGPLDNARFRLGAEALESVGLARFIAGDVSLGPLARAIDEPSILGVLEAEVSVSAWTESARAAMRSVPASPAVGEGDRLTGEFFAFGAGWDGEVRVPLEMLATRVLGLSSASTEAKQVLVVLDKLARTAWFQEPTEDLAPALRWLEEVGRSPDAEARLTSGVLDALLRFLSARGHDAIHAQERSLRVLETIARERSDAWIVPPLSAVRFRYAGLLIRRQRSLEDLSRAEDLISKCIDDWTREPAPALLAAGDIRLGEIAARREQRARAREWYERSIARARDLSDTKIEAAGLLALARLEIEERRLTEAEHHARASLSLSEKVNNGHGVVAAMLALARCLVLEGTLDQDTADLVISMWRAAASINDLEAMVEAVQLAVSSPRATLLMEMMSRGKSPEALLEEALSLAEQADAPLLVAKSHHLLGRAARGRGALDEAVEFYQMAIRIYDDAGATANAARLRRSVERMRTPHPAPPPSEPGPISS